MAKAFNGRSAYLVRADSAKCAGCMTCMLRCSFRIGGTFNLASSRVQVKRLVKQANEFEVTFMDDCDSCGTCVRYCPYGALDSKKVQKVA